MRPRWKHSSIRLRLTLVYAVVLVGICTTLLGLNYALLYRSLYTRPGAPSAAEFEAGFGTSVGRNPETDEKIRFYRQQQAEIARLRTDTLLHAAGTSAVGLAGAAVLAFTVSWIVAGRMLRPLRSLTATTRRISHDRLHERIALAGSHDELKELADTFDEMIARLEASFNSQRRFVADASHELRTPLAIVRTGTEVLLSKRDTTVTQWQALGHRILTATGRTEQLLDGLLALARSDGGVITHVPHDLALAAGAAVSQADAAAERAGLDLTTDLRSAAVNGDPILLEHLVRNLVENAIRYNHRGGWIDVTTTGHDGQAVLSVRNSGELIPPTEVDRLFEPFQRLATDRHAGPKSTGLGLAIVKSIVHAHAGTVTAAPNTGGGLRVTVTLPAVDNRLPAAEPARRSADVTQR